MPFEPASPSDQLIVELKKIFVLQNTFHWIKSITVETKEGNQISSGHFKPLHSRRYVNDCHGYIFHLTKLGTTPLDRLAVGWTLRRQMVHQKIVSDCRARFTVPWQ